MRRTGKTDYAKQFEKYKPRMKPSLLSSSKSTWVILLGILSSIAHAQSCANFGALLGRPDELAKIATAAQLQACTGRVLVWVPPQSFNGTLLPGHYELGQTASANIQKTQATDIEAACFVHAKTMLFHSDRCKSFESRIDALSAQNNSCPNGFVVGGLMTIHAEAAQAGCDYRP